MSYVCGDLQGCSHGTWKNRDLWPSGYAKGDLLTEHFGDVIGRFNLQEDTLEMALEYGGGPGFEGGAKILLRNAVASLLNAAAEGVNFSRSEYEVWLAVTEALESGDRDTAIALEEVLDALNNLGCPLGN